MTLPPPPPLPPPSVLAHLIDVHAHPTDSPTYSLSDTPALSHTLVAMSSHTTDQPKVASLAAAQASSIIPAFGYHPWWTHAISLRSPAPPPEEHYRELFLSGTASRDGASGKEKGAKEEQAFQTLLPALESPRSLGDILTELRANLVAFPAAMLGEVGIDRAARVPYPPSPDSTVKDEDGWERRELSPFTTPPAHQLAVLEAQLALAVELRRNISFHSVKASSQTRALLDRMAVQHGAAFRAISVDLHSCGLSPEVWLEIEKHHPNAYLSLSTAINGRSPNHLALIRAVSPTRLLAESDYPYAHLSAPQTWGIVLTIAETRGWRVEKAWDYDDAGTEGEGNRAVSEDTFGVVRRLEENWKAFVRGGHSASTTGEKMGKSRPRRRKDYSYDVWESGEESEGDGDGDEGVSNRK